MTALVIITSQGIGVFYVPCLHGSHAIAGPLLALGRAFCLPMGVGA